MPIAERYITNRRSPSAGSRDQGRLNGRSPPTSLIWSDNSLQVSHGAGRSGSTKNEGEEVAGQQGRDVLQESRQDLIERVKRDQRATWLGQDTITPSSLLPTQPQPTPKSLRANKRSSLLPPLEAEEDQPGYNSKLALEPPSSIERPRSALHRGDFRAQAEDNSLFQRPVSPLPKDGATENAWLGSSPPPPWLSHQTTSNYSIKPRFGSQTTSTPIAFQHKRSISSSLGNFVFQAPTSPLARSSHITDLDPDDEASTRARKRRSPDRSGRRRTFSPGALSSLKTPSRRLPNIRREGVFPYQAHQPRRSIPSLSSSLSLESTPVSPAWSRKPSRVSDVSPLQRAPMIGRYEESILRGRMSSLPSRPLDFIAQIGVLGRGNCKRSLLCPSHVTVPFPAVFFRSDDGRKSLNETPSPYVGMILMEHSQPIHADENTVGSENTIELDDPAQKHKLRRRRKKENAESKVPKGGYRIPEKGQLQIIIRNPNRTAVKLFLVPYDLSGMEAGQKTFIRQKSFSVGPDSDAPLNASNTGIERPILRYVINLQICCPTKGRYYLYKSIRVVFANRVPDDKEKLRYELSLPEPRFSAYKPEREEPSTLPQAALEEVNTPTVRPLTFNSLQDRNKHLMEQAVETPMGTPGERRNFAWETYAQQDDFTFPAVLPSTNLGSPEKVLSDDSSSLSEQMSQQSTLSRPVSRGSPLALRGATSPESPSRPFFERLHRDDWASAGYRQRTRSPGLGPGESLIAKQHRNMSVRSRSGDEKQT